MKKSLVLVLFFAYTSMAWAQNHHTIYDYDKHKIIECTTQNGMLNGKYTSYYPNGIKKSEGQYADNQRVGTWTVWDSHGNKRIERVFENALDSKIVNAWDSLGAKIDIVNYNNTAYTSYDKQLGYKKWYPVTEKEILWSHRLWRFVPSDSAVNKTLFDEGRLYKILYKGIQDHSITCYADEEFRTEMDAGKFPPFEKTNIKGLRIKEDVFYNKTTNLAEIRILAIGIESLISEKKSTTLAWFYFPDLRDYLANQLLPKSLGKDIRSFENIFTERYFSSNVYKESNVYDREIADYNTGIPTIMGSLLVEMQTLDNELEYWFKK
jgi:antitoxin component YwqK of YwqJK toxin-antitoxin module